MTWIFYALLAPAVYAVVNFVDKFIVEKEVKDYRGLVVFIGVAGLIVGTLFFIFTNGQRLPLRDELLIMTSGALLVWGSVFYFKAISQDQTSDIILLFQMIPILILIFAYVFLRETITLKQTIGFLIVLAACTAVEYKGSLTKFRISSTFWLMLIYDLCSAAAAILIKFSLTSNTFSQIVSYESWGVALGGLILYAFFPTIRHAFHENVAAMKHRTFVAVSINEIFFIIAKALTFFAYSIGPTALVSVVGSTQVFFGIFYGFILTTLRPRIFKEDISRAALIKKIALAFVLFIGIMLIY